MWKNSLKSVESGNNKIFLRDLIRFFLQRNGTCFLNKPRRIKIMYCYNREKSLLNGTSVHGAKCSKEVTVSTRFALGESINFVVHIKQQLHS